MLQPKVVVGDFKHIFFIVFNIIFILYANPVLSQVVENDSEIGEVKPTPVLKNTFQDVATVLVVDKNNRAAHGRFLNIKPDIGLLKSTARTFIQDGITTEYVTQVIGTTQDNGQYVQLLTTTSRVLYDGDNVNNLQTKTHIPNTIDKDNDDTFINNHPTSPFLQNVDYIVPHDPYLVFPIQNHKKISNNEIVNSQSDNDEVENTIRFQNIIDKSHESDRKPEKEILKPNKVVPDANLPTFTIGRDSDGPVFRAEPQIGLGPRAPKELTYYEETSSEEAKILPSVTYYGFADFTTTVGDTVIIFSPSTAKPFDDLNNHVTSIQGEPTLKEKVKPTTTKEAYDKPVPMFTEKVKKVSIQFQSAIPSLPPKEIATTEQAITTEEPETTETLTTTTHKKVDETTTKTESETTTKYEEKTTQETSPLPETTPKKDIYVVGITPEAIEPSQSSAVDFPGLSTPSDDDIAKILASINNREQATQKLDVKANQEIDSTPIVSQNDETKILTGSKIIFFDDIISSSEVTTTTEKSVIKKLETTPQTEATTEGTTTEKITTEAAPPKTEPKEPVKEKKCEKTQYKTLTYLTTFYIPVDDVITTTSIKSSVSISTVIKPTRCRTSVAQVEPTRFEEPTTTAPTPKPQQNEAIEHDLLDEKIETTTASLTDKEDDHETTIEQELETTEKYTTIQRKPTTVQPPTTMVDNEDEKETATPETTTYETVTEEQSVDEETTVESSSEDDIEIIYKTLYTTYTYLTTFFQESTTSVSSKKEVVTNVITSTINANDFSQLFGDLEPSKDVLIEPTQVQDVGAGRPTSQYLDFVALDHLLQSDFKAEDTPKLDDALENNEIKTLYTTYTYFTTLFDGSQTEIVSRTDVYTNIINPSSTQSFVKDILETKFVEPLKDNNSIDDKESSDRANGAKKLNFDVEEVENKVDPANGKSYSTMIRNSGEIESSGLENGEQFIKMNVESSTSEGQSNFIENIDRNYNVLDDQVSSESNNEERVPTPTLLLQTRYTTFTYFTTMYAGSSTSNILSRLETITNVVTETIQPTQVQKVEDATLPVTYFTTFTYWTTFYKDGSTRVTSREETVSNVVTPSAIVLVDDSTPVSVILPIDKTAILEAIEPTISTEPIKPSSAVEVGKALEPTTVYTTFTYYTTSYVGDETVINSRLETVQNIIEPSIVDSKQGGRAIDLSNKNNLLDGDEKPLIKNKEILAIEASPVSDDKVNPTNIVSINEGKIVDADEISTTYYTTKTIGKYIDDKYTEVVESSSSIQIDEIKKAILPSDFDQNRQYKTGLVRSIDGTIVSNNVTTLYVSKVLGTIIDGRYAQVIESTSSILPVKAIEATSIKNELEIQPTTVSSLNAIVTPTSLVISPTPAVLEGSISESAVTEQTEESDNEDAKKRPPVFRPFASRSRPIFNPKQRKSSVNAPAIITPTEITPTIKATAVKSERNRFGSGRRSSANINNLSSASIATSSSSLGFTSRRFARPSSARIQPTSARIQPTSARIQPTRTSSARIQPTSSFAPGRRTPQFRSSIAPGRLASSSILPTNSRVRIRPSLASALDKTTIQSTQTTPNIEQDDEDITTLVTDDPTNVDSEEESQTEAITTTTENTRRNNNPLLRFRRPPGIARQTSAASTTPRSSPTVSTRRNPLARTSRASTTTTTTTTPKPRSRNLVRPSLPPVVINTSRNRASGGLFPPRGLFSRTTPAPQELVDNDEEEDENDSGEEYEDFSETKIAEVKTAAGGKKRFKRQTDYGTRSPVYNFRYKKPTTTRRNNENGFTYASDEILVEAPKTRTTTSRYSNQRSRGSKNYSSSNNANSNSNNDYDNSNTKIKPTTASQSNNRLLFTLREKDSNQAVTPRASNFKRPVTSYNTRRTPSTRTSSTRFRYSGSQDYQGSRNSNSRTNTRNSNNRRPTSRTRSRNDNLDAYVQPSFDGTITVTHHIPTETTISVINNGKTEYKNIVTARISTEIVGPKQYTSSVGKNGIDTTYLLDESTAINHHGQTEITQFVLLETPTTGVIFTPTTIRGRKTSFSHIIPSTVYEASAVVSTVFPSLINNAPLANILLSQLLLGNIGLPQQQPAALNPLLGLQPQPQLIPQMPATPVTEYKTRSTTYVTTIANGKSTVLPVTFRGREILTTIYDESTQVVTATEFITDTIVITPTQTVPQQQQLNSLLLPLLLQQQQQQQLQPQLQAQSQQNLLGLQGLQNINTLPNSFDILNREALESLSIPDEKQIQSVKDEPLPSDSSEDYSENYEEIKPIKKAKKPKIETKPQKQLDSSVITLYVSGRRPGEFSTVLSTVISDQDGNPVYKRSASYVDVKPSALPKELDILEAEASNNFYEYILAGSDNEINPERRDNEYQETESLEVVLGNYNQQTSSITF